MTQKKIEQRAFMVGLAMNLLMGSLGIVVYYITQIQALFVDSYFTIMTLVSGIAAITISKYSARTSERFPNGHFMFEPMYAAFKSMMTLILLTASTIQVSQKAYQYFVYHKGDVLNLTPIIPYEIIMVILCLTISLFYSRQNQKIGRASTMLSAESKSTRIDSIMCGGIGLAAFLVLLIPKNSILGFLLYTGDFFVTVILVLFSITTPVKVLKNAFIEICGGRLIDENIQNEFEACLRKHFGKEVILTGCHIYKTGMYFSVKVMIDVVDDEIGTGLLRDKKVRILEELKACYEFVHLEFVYA